MDIRKELSKMTKDAMLKLMLGPAEYKANRHRLIKQKKAYILEAFKIYSEVSHKAAKRFMHIAPYYKNLMN